MYRLRSLLLDTLLGVVVLAFVHDCSTPFWAIVDNLIGELDKVHDSLLEYSYYSVKQSKNFPIDLSEHCENIPTLKL